MDCCCAEVESNQGSGQTIARKSFHLSNHFCLQHRLLLPVPCQEVLLSSLLKERSVMGGGQYCPAADTQQTAVTVFPFLALLMTATLFATSSHNFLRLMIHCHASLVDVEYVLRWYLSTAVVSEKFFFSTSSNTLIFARSYPRARCIEVLSIQSPCFSWAFLLHFVPSDLDVLIFELSLIARAPPFTILWCFAEKNINFLPRSNIE